MSGENRWEDTAADRKESAAETTSIGLPPTTDEVSPETSLSTEERATDNPNPPRYAHQEAQNGHQIRAPGHRDGRQFNR
ncbi:MAG: hypothetical protein ACTHZK_02305, partial [Arthrobacter sp.]